MSQLETTASFTAHLLTPLLHPPLLMLVLLLTQCGNSYFIHSVKNHECSLMWSVFMDLMTDVAGIVSKLLLLCCAHTVHEDELILIRKEE